MLRPAVLLPQQLQWEGTAATFWGFDVNLIFRGVRKPEDMAVKQPGLRLSAKSRKVDQKKGWRVSPS